MQMQDEPRIIIPSPLNYTGGKYKLLPQLLPLFPGKIRRMIDLFCGGCSVGINVKCREVVLNDKNAHLIHMLQSLTSLSKEELWREVEGIIEQYGLSRSDQHGYAFYSCNSSDGMGSYNREPYLRLREDFNRCQTMDARYDIMLFVLIVYAFNHQIRFNRKGEFNLPVGKRDFNTRIQQKLSLFLDRIKCGNYTFQCKDFRETQYEAFLKDTFIYADPPYLITCAPYNEQNGWSETDERDLLEFLDQVHRRGNRFALSNVLDHKGKRNEILYQWLEAHKGEYQAIDLNYNYSNSNYHTKRKEYPTREILVVNSRNAEG